MATAEWDIPFEIVTPYGGLLGTNLFLNVDLGASMGPTWAGRQFRTNPGNCTSKRSVRATTDAIPQGDGEIFHERYATGYEMKLAVQLWMRFPSDEEGRTEGDVACDEALCEMRDLLFGHLWSLLRTVEDGGRVIWDPSCGDRRMIDAARLLSIDDPVLGELGVTEYSTIIDSPFPYAIDLTQDSTSIANTVTATVPNDGNVEFWPVIKVFAVGSATTAFTLEADTGLLIEWDASYGGVGIGAGDYAEIDTFKGTIFLNGNEDDLSGSLVATTSDFFPIGPVVGTSVNAIGSGGFDHAEFLTNNAWA